MTNKHLLPRNHTGLFKNKMATIHTIMNIALEYRITQKVPNHIFFVTDSLFISNQINNEPRLSAPSSMERKRSMNLVF